MIVRGVESEEAVIRDLTVRCAVYLARLNPAGAEIHSAVVGVLFGCVLLAIEGAFSRSPAYGHLASIGPQWAWGAIWLIVALGQLFGVLLDGVFGGRFWRLHQAGTFAMTTLWVFWLWSYWTSAGITTATTTYAVLVVGSGWGWLRVGR